MKIIVSVQALFDEGEVAWGYHLEENIVPKVADIDPAELISSLKGGKRLPPNDEEKVQKANLETAGETLEALLAQLDLARESILRQASAELIDPEA